MQLIVPHIFGLDNILDHLNIIEVCSLINNVNRIGDYKDYFITAQIVVSLDGIIWSVHLGKGHNNDQGMFHLSGVANWLAEQKIKLLSDRGYFSVLLVTPRNMKNSVENDDHKRYRSIVERLFGFTKVWAFAAERCRYSVQIQQVALFIIYSFVNDYVKEYPLVK